jgi:membrane protease YdiL (CAAX protease family)
MANQVQNKPTAAYVLSLIGGIIGLIASIFVMFVWGILGWLTASAYEFGFDFTGIFLIWTVFGVWMLVTSVLVIVFARRLNANPMEHSKYGAYILIFSIIGVGGLLGLIGGILALVYKPIPAGATPQYPPQQQYYGPQPQPAAYQPPPQTRVCPQCGTQMQANVRFCPNCGRQQY